MNLVDWLVLAVIGVSLLFGLYRGFIASMLGLLCLFAAMFAAYALGPALATLFLNDTSVVTTLAHYTDTASRLGDLALSLRPVAGLDSAAIADVVARVGFPAPFDALLQGNLVQQAFASIGSVNVSDYVNQTIITAIISILCYLLVFIASYIALSLIAGLFRTMFRFPALKHLDALLGGIFGVARGVFIAYILFALVPILMTVLPFNEFGDLIEASQLGSALYKSNIVLTILQGHI
ncbi:hypothetical protein FACS1894196_1840 [Clostridia bacterium]|nr:hypothetical protein FACS1894196_1790 [Clostridia bacterium]GHU82854.1 hypothetical protein FACS1894196_1840 [Clostridia bacterium]